MSTMSMMPIPQNYKKNVDWILGAYSDAGVTFPNGFQKDAIQNSAGARKNSKWKGWHCDITYIENKFGSFVVIEDSGTVGLTGRNIPGSEINQLMTDGKEFPPEERLARFTSLFNSGGNEGAGLYGAGKSVYSAASEQYTYFFDSLREDGTYVANLNKEGQVREIAYEDDEARQFILDNVGMSAKDTIGTRVIIVSPKKELVVSITTGSIIPYIQESWWLIIQRLPNDAAITVNGISVKVPDGIKEASKFFELPAPMSFATGYKVKHFGLYVFDTDSIGWSGISYYRKGMKIGEIDIKDIPKEVANKFWGYIEVDENWEIELSKIENKVHFGVSKGKKNTLAYQHMKNYCNSKFYECMIEWGFIKGKENVDKKLKDEVKIIAEELHTLLDKLKFSDLGQGPRKADFDIRWQNICYPEDNTEKVTSGDSISFSVRIKNSYTAEKMFNYKLVVIDPKSGSEISKISEGELNIPSNGINTQNFVHKISKDNSNQFAENRILLTVKINGRGKAKEKYLPYFFDIDKPDNHRENVILTLHECTFPTPNSRRVNFGESIHNICWRIENKCNYTLNYRLNVSVHNASDKTCPKIADMTSFEGALQPFEETVTPYVKKIIFDQNTYEPYLAEGILELRARLIANKDDAIYEKGDKITFYNHKIYLNTDEKNGKADSFETELANAPDRYERSWRIPGNNRKITLNIGHAAYQNLSDYPDIQHDYLREQMMKQYVLLYLDEGTYDVFGEDFINLEPQEATDKVLEKLENVYYESLK